MWKCQSTDFRLDPAFKFIYSFACLTPSYNSNGRRLCGGPVVILYLSQLMFTFSPRNQKRPRVDKVDRLAKVFDISTSSFFPIFSTQTQFSIVLQCSKRLSVFPSKAILKSLTMTFDEIFRFKTKYIMKRQWISGKQVVTKRKGGEKKKGR